MADSGSEEDMQRMKRTRKRPPRFNEDSPSRKEQHFLALMKGSKYNIILLGIGECIYTILYRLIN